MTLYDTLEPHLEDLLNRARAALLWLDAHSPDSHQVDYIQGIADAYSHVLGQLGLGTPCDRRECTYYTHYLAYGPPALSHDQFHAAERQCERMQQLAQSYLDAGRDVPPNIERITRTWENKVRA